MTLMILAAATLLNPTIARRARATEQDERLQEAGR